MVLSADLFPGASVEPILTWEMASIDHHFDSHGAIYFRFVFIWARGGDWARARRGANHGPGFCAVRSGFNCSSTQKSVNSRLGQIAIRQGRSDWPDLLMTSYFEDYLRTASIYDVYKL